MEKLKIKKTLNPAKYKVTDKSRILTCLSLLIYRLLLDATLYLEVHWTISLCNIMQHKYITWVDYISAALYRYTVCGDIWPLPVFLCIDFFLSLFSIFEFKDKMPETSKDKMNPWTTTLYSTQYLDLPCYCKGRLHKHT